MTTRHVTLLALATIVGCAAGPLGPEWERLGAVERDARAVEALRELFTSRVDVEGEPRPDDAREVVSVDVAGIVYEGHGGRSTLRWTDVEAVEQDAHVEVPGRPVDLRLYVRRDSPSAETVRDLVEPRTPLAGLLRPHLRLGWRERSARARLVAALEHVSARAGADATAPVTAATSQVSSSTPAAASTGTPARATEPARLDEAEATLRRLRAWREDGLITDDEYEAKRRALLEGL